MPKFDEFDLDVKLGIGTNNDDSKTISIIGCIPGTCFKGCNTTITATCITSCCPGNISVKTCYKGF